MARRNKLIIPDFKMNVKRFHLCGRPNAERVALRMTEATGVSHAVISTNLLIQQFKVVPAHEADPDLIEMEVVL